VQFNECLDSKKHSDKINNLLNTVRYSFIESEQGYVKKEQALDLKIKYERKWRIFKSY